MNIQQTIARLALPLCVTWASAIAAQAATLTYTTDLALWLEADQGVTKSGNTVTAWADQSGNGHDGSYTVGAPQLVSAAINGLPAISFDGVDDNFALAGGAVLSSDNFTIFAVAVDTGDNAGGAREIYSNWDGANSWSSQFLGTTDGSGSNRSARFTDGLVVSDAVSSPATPFILWGAYEGGVNADLLVNGSLSGSNAQNSLPADAGNPNGQRDVTTPSFIGQQGSFHGESWQGQIAEVLVYNALLTPEQQAQVYDYLSAKWTTAPEPGGLALLGSAALVLLSVIVRRRWGVR